MYCLIVDDSPIVLVGLRSLIEQENAEWRVISAASVDEALSILGDGCMRNIRLLLVDNSMLDQLDSTLLQRAVLPIVSPGISCLVLASSVDLQTIERCRNLRVRNMGIDIRGIVSRRTAPATLIEAIRTIISGGEYFERSATGGPSDNIVCKLTARQQEIVSLVLAGYSNKRIASALNLSYGTVKNYMFNLMKQLSVNSRLELAVKVRTSGWNSDT